MLYQALLPAGLVDQLALITFPVMLGRGKRWYSGDPATARSWTLVEQAHSPKGVHFASFARDGEVRTGSFATKPRAKTNLRSVSVKRRVVGEPAALRPPIQQKVLIALWADETPFKFRMLGPDHPENGDELRRGWPFGQFPCWLMVVDHWSKPLASSIMCRRSIRAQPLDSGRRARAARSLPRKRVRPPRNGEHTGRHVRCIATGRASKPCRPQHCA